MKAWQSSHFNWNQDIGPTRDRRAASPWLPIRLDMENSGVMTFIVSHDGKVFQKNLGNDTAAVAAAMTLYNLDVTWVEVKE